MAPRRGKPIERHPKLAGQEPVPRNWGIIQKGIPYRPRDHPEQEDWESVADKFDVSVKELIYFNFMTDNPDVVNWYLKNYVGCEKVSPSGNNYMFSNRARPGIIYIPPDDKKFTYDPEQICSWSPKREEEFIRRLFAVAKGIPGNRGNRIKRLMQVISNAGYPGWKDLWYYNDIVIEAFVDWKTAESDRLKSVQSTKGALPFDGQAVWHSQHPSEAGGTEHSMGMWRIHPVKKMFDDFCDHADALEMKKRLLAIDDEMYKGWYALSLINFKTQFGGGGAYTQIIEDFLNHVIKLSQDKTHLYWAFGQ